MDNQLIIDWDYANGCHIANDNWARQCVTPFTVACYVYHAYRTLGKDPYLIKDALKYRWDSFMWRNTATPIQLWNKLFNGVPLSSDEWSKVIFPLIYIDSILTNVTSPDVKRECYPTFYGITRNVPNELMVVTKESYTKTHADRKSSKVTAYRYGEACKLPNPIEGLRIETQRVVIPFN